MRLLPLIASFLGSSLMIRPSNAFSISFHRSPSNQVSYQTQARFQALKMTESEPEERLNVQTEYTNNSYPHTQYYKGVYKLINELIKDNPHACEILQDVDDLCFESYSQKVTTSLCYEKILRARIDEAIDKDELGLLIHTLEKLQSHYVRIPRQKKTNVLDLGPVDMCIYHLKAFKISDDLINNLIDHIKNHLKEEHGFLKTVTIKQLRAQTQSLLRNIEASE